MKTRSIQILFSMLLVMALAALAFGWPQSPYGRGNSGNAVRADDSLDVVTDPIGAVTLGPWAGQLGGIGSLTKVASIVPLTPLGHSAVKLNWLQYNTQAGAAEDVRGKGEGDSIAMYPPIMILRFRNGIADTVCKNPNGVGLAGIPLAAWCGVFTPISNTARIENAWTKIPSQSRQWQAKSFPATFTPYIEGDSIQVWFGKYAPGATMAPYFNIGAVSFPRITIDRAMSVFYCDTATSRYGAIRLARVDSSVKCAWKYLAFDMGPRHTLATNSPYGNRLTSDTTFDRKQLEMNWSCFWGNYPPLNTTLAKSLSVKNDSDATYQYVYLNVPAGKSGVNPFTGIIPPGRLSPTTYNAIWIRKVQQTQTDSSWFPYTGTMNLASAADSQSKGNYYWRIRIQNDNWHRKPAVDIDSGAAVTIFNSEWNHWDGTEDIALDGFYGDSTGIQLTGTYTGISPNWWFGIDSTATTGTGAHKHWGFYQCYASAPGTSERIYPRGFDLFYRRESQPSFTALLDAFVWRFQSTLAVLQFKNTSGAALGGAPALGRCCYGSTSGGTLAAAQYASCRDHLTNAACTALSGVWTYGATCFDPCFVAPAGPPTDSLYVGAGDGQLSQYVTTTAWANVAPCAGICATANNFTAVDDSARGPAWFAYIDADEGASGNRGCTEIALPFPTAATFYPNGDTRTVASVTLRFSYYISQRYRSPANDSMLVVAYSGTSTTTTDTSVYRSQSTTVLGKIALSSLTVNDALTTFHQVSVSLPTSVRVKGTDTYLMLVPSMINGSKYKSCTTAVQSGGSYLYQGRYYSREGVSPSQYARLVVTFQ